MDNERILSKDDLAYHFDTVTTIGEGGCRKGRCGVCNGEVSLDSLTEYGEDILLELSRRGGMTNVEGAKLFKVYRNNFYRKMQSLEEDGWVERVSTGENVECEYVWFLTVNGVCAAGRLFADQDNPCCEQ